jgi:LPXTG-motif cell wall-anchored protein
VFDEGGGLLLTHTIIQAFPAFAFEIGNPDDSDITSTYNVLSALRPVMETALAGTGVQFDADAKLGPLGPNGGPTDTHLLLAGSAALNTGDPAFVPPPSTDQRGDPRVVGGRIDVGAVEMPATLPATGGAVNAGWPLIAVLLLALGAAALVVRRRVIR